MSIWTSRLPLSTPVSPWWACVIIAGATGLFCGWLNNWMPLFAPAVERPVRIPALWRIPKLAGMGSLRLAMVNDVLLDRFAVRGPAWYAARNAASAARIAAWEAAGGEPPAEVLDAFDDLAVGQDRLGDDPAAIATMQRKAAVLHLDPPTHRDLPAERPKRAMEAAAIELQAVRARGALAPADHHRYTTLANLGTALIHRNLHAAMAGDDAAAAQVQRGLACLDGAVAINPSAHFGRETWQIVAVEHLLASRSHPDLLLRFDLIGDPLPHGHVASNGSPYGGRVTVFEWPWRYVGHAVPDDPAVSERVTRSHDRLFGPDWTVEWVDQHITDSERLSTRNELAQVGMDEGWVALVHPSRIAPAPFDEPLLGLMGMWTWGGGPNPHAALAIATICERIGQRHLAFAAYERCLELADRFSPDPGTRSGFTAHCRDREIELARSIDPVRPDAWLAAERQRRAAELAWAHRRREAARQQEEAALQRGALPEGIPLGDGDARPLASPVGTADERWGVSDVRVRRGDGLATALLAMAVTGWLGIGIDACVRRWRRRSPAAR